jgi:hypothetical protein
MSDGREKRELPIATYTHPTDWILGRSTDGSYVSITSEVRGESEKSRIIDYCVPPKNLRMKFLTQTLQSPASG